MVTDRTVPDAFEGCPTSVVSDALDRIDLDAERVVTGLAPADPDWHAAGRALPLRFEPVADPGEPTNFPFAMLEAMAPDAVFVIDGAAPDLSCWGGLASRLAAQAGMAGVVVDGGFRDVPEVRRSDLPVFGRQPTPKSSQRRVEVAAVGDPVTVDGVSVEADDVVVADATGVVVVPGDDVEEVAAAATTILEEESTLDDEIASGLDLETLEERHEGF